MGKMFAMKINLPILNEVLMAIIIQSPWFTVGVVEGYTAFLLPEIQKQTSNITVSDVQASWLGSLGMFVYPAGCLVGGLAMEVFGRKPFLIICQIPFVISWCITGLATGVPMLYCGRIFAGLASGMVFCTPTYISEIVSTERRGLLLALEEPWYSLGVVFSNVIVVLTGWRYSTFIFGGCSVALFGCSFLPCESPNWLVRKNLIEEALNSLARIRTSVEEANKDVDKLRSYYYDEEATRSIHPRQWSNLTRSHCWKPFCILLGLFTITAGTGSKFLIVYTVAFVEQLRLPVVNTAAVCVLFSAVRVVGSLLPFMSAVYFGRKLSLAISGSGMAVAIGVVLAYEKIVPIANRTEDCLTYLFPLIGLYAYNLFYCLAAMTLPYTMAGELFPPDVAAFCTGVYGTVGFVIVGIVLNLYPTFLYNFGILASLRVMTICSFSLLLYAVYVLPETKGKALNEVIQSNQEEFDDGKNISSSYGNEVEILS